MAAKETEIDANYLNRILKATEEQTAWTHELYDGGWPDAPHRALINSTYINWINEGSPRPGSRSNEGALIGNKATGENIKLYQSYTPGTGTTGDVEAMSLWAGQGVALVKNVMSAGDIINEIHEDAKSLLKI